MTLEEFGRNVSRSGLLTLTEMVLFYDKFSGEERASEVWNMSERGAKEEILLRCCRFSYYGTSFSFQGEPVTWKNELCFLFSKAVKFRGVHLLGVEGREYDVKLEVLSQSIENKFRAQKNTRDITGFDVMLLQPIKVQTNIIVHVKVTIRGLSGGWVGSKQKKIAETNGITVNFFKMSDITFGRTNVSVEEDDYLDEIIFSET